MDSQLIKTKIKDYSDKLEAKRDLLTAVIPNEIKFDLVKSSIESEFIKNPDLLKCTFATIYASIKTVVNVGLIPNSNVGHCYFVPYKDKLTVIIGYKGYIDLLYRSGLVKSVEAHAVFEGDIFEYSFGLNKDIKHQPQGNKNPDQLTHVYGIIELMTGGILFDVMTRPEIEKTRNESAGYKHSKFKAGTIWAIHFVEMAKKTIIRRLSKLAPLSVEVRNIAGIDESGDYGKQNLLSSVSKDFSDIEEAEIIEEALKPAQEIKEEKQIEKTEIKHEVTRDAISQLNNILERKRNA